MKNVCLIGSTGSIGKQTLDVISRHNDKFRLTGLVACSSRELFLRQVGAFLPRYAALADETAAKELAPSIPKAVRFGGGFSAAKDAMADADIVLVAAAGFAGLRYTLEAIALGKDVALANKETLVCGGELVMPLIKAAGTRLFPVDSEHSALWQALSFHADAPYKKLIITASGGPFYGKAQDQLKNIAPADALRHPTWSMGRKITIDSATLLNKGFEVIEAKWLYDAPLEKIHTLVQPESIIHSMVEFEDGSVLAQMSYPTMEIPIQLALSYPERIPSSVPSLDFERLGSIRFLPLCRKDFPCYDLALQAAEEGGNLPCALNAAGEIAVHAFLKGRIPFLSIAETMQEVLNRTGRAPVTDYEGLFETDTRARRLAEEIIEKGVKHCS